MTIWDEQALGDKIVDALAALRWDESHHFGRPYMSAYQLAIEIARRYPETAEAIGKPLGGAGTGQADSLAQYVALELSKRIRAAGSEYPVEGAFLSNRDVAQIRFLSADGVDVTSSLTGTPFPLSLFRLRSA